MSVRRPDVLAVMHLWPPPTFLQFTLERLAASGLKITVAAPRPDAPLPDVAGVSYLPLPGPADTPRKVVPGLLRDLASLARSDRRRLATLLRAWRRELRRHQADDMAGRLRTLRAFAALGRVETGAIHFQFEEAAASHVELARVWTRPVITSCRAQVNLTRTVTPRGEHLRPRMAEVLARSDAVHAVSSQLAAVAVDLGADPDRTTLIHPALDPAYFRPAARGRESGGVLRIVSSGWLRWLKGHEYALEALRRLLDAGVPARLELLGDSPPRELDSGDRERFLHAVADLGLEPHVDLRGRVSPLEVRARLARSDVLLHASLTEGLPNAVIEGMATGLPVVTTDCGGVREAVRHGTDGYVVALRDAEGLARSLGQLARDPGLRRRMGQAARTRVESKFGINAQVERFLGLYAGVGVAARA